MKSVNQKGFSLVEVLLVILILVVVGGVGYLIYARTDKDGAAKQSSQTSADSDAADSTPLTVDEAVAKLGDKYSELNGGKYRLEKLDGSAASIKASATETETVKAGNSVFYRTDLVGVDSSYEATYADDSLEYGAQLNSYAVDELSLQKVYTYEETNPAALTYKQTVYKLGDQYIEISVPDEPGGVTIAWTE